MDGEPRRAQRVKSQRDTGIEFTDIETVWTHDEEDYFERRSRRRAHALNAETRNKPQTKKPPKKGKNAKRLEKHYINICANSAVPLRMSDEERWEKAMTHAEECTKVTVCGPAGSGKSTLINILIGNVVAAIRPVFTTDPVTKDIYLYFMELKTGGKLMFFDTPAFSQTVVDFLRTPSLSMEVVLFAVEFKHLNSPETTESFQNLETILSENLFRRLIILVTHREPIKDFDTKKQEYVDCIPASLREHDVIFVDLKHRRSCHANERWRKNLLMNIVHYTEVIEIDTEENTMPKKKILCLEVPCPIQ